MDLFFVHSSDDGHFCCFQVLAIVNTGALHDFPSCVFLILAFTGYRPKSGPSGSYGNSIFTSKRTAILVLLLAVTTLHPR